MTILAIRTSPRQPDGAVRPSALARCLFLPLTNCPSLAASAGII